MGRWKPNARAFPVHISHDVRRGSQVNVPRPVLELLGNPDQLTFRIERGKILIESGDTTRPGE